jgi:signal transduction histidine kinase
VRKELRFLIAAVVVMLIGVATSLGVLVSASRSLSVAHGVIVDNAAPSVVALDDAQARLRLLHTLVLKRELGASGDAAVRDAAIAVARRALEQEIDEYMALPTDPGEVPFQRAIRESLPQMNLVIDRALAVAPGSAANDATMRHDLDDAMARLSLDLARTSEFSAQLAKTAAVGVVGVSKTMLPLSAVIEGLTFLAAAVTLALTYRAVRRAEALWATSRSALDRRAEELELFAGRVAHDLLSPLMTLSLAMDLASQRLAGPEDATARHAVARATKTLHRVRRFVTDLLEFARAGARPTPGSRASVGDAVREIADEFAPIAHEAGVELRVESEGAGRDVACSSGVLTSALSNLVQNAIKYIGEGEIRRVSIRTEDRAGEVRVEVEDTGPGIARADRERLFEPYARGRDAKAPGLGLGLATVRRLVESHGGHVGVQARPEGGTVFWFSLPVAA